MPKKEREKTAIIIGAGPAGLTVALELIRHTKIKPIIFEKSKNIGGISKTVKSAGYRMDMGGHRFFSKSDRVMNWWREILPIEEMRDQELDRVSVKPKKDKGKNSFLIRRRISRIFFNSKFFDYPLSLRMNTLTKLGLANTFFIIIEYIHVKLFPIKKENSLEDFYINKFGKRLYQIFFESYTKKLWGIHPKNISSEWGAQRVKGVSLKEAMLHSLKSMFTKNSSTIDQKNVETSLIQRFMYPKYGPGHLWETVANKVENKGGKMLLRHNVIGLTHSNEIIKSVEVLDIANKEKLSIKADYVFSTMPVPELLEGLTPEAPSPVLEVGAGLEFRDFISVGLLLNKLKITNKTDIKTRKKLIPDNWVYIQEPGVKVCRIQVFNNWSPYLVKDKTKVWIGMEYVCSKEDPLWKMSKKELEAFAIDECAKMGIASKKDFIWSCIEKMEKVYPAYFGTYDRFDEIRKYTDSFKNLYLIGRNGMHRYNNMDHSMLSAFEAVACILEKRKSKNRIWNVNAEKDYHEAK